MAQDERSRNWDVEDPEVAADPDATNAAQRGAAEEPLELGTEERLPWLEDSEYDDAPPAGGTDTARLIGFALLGLVALAAFVGLLWWLTNDGPDREMVADGSLIEAPDGPVKVRPDDPGGRTFAGTGDVAPAVGEGQTRDGRLAATPEPAPAAAVDAAAPAVADGAAVQVAAYSSRARADEGWTQLQGRTDALSGLRYRVVEGQADIGTVFRLQALPGDPAAAQRLCTRLQADGVACQVK